MTIPRCMFATWQLEINLYLKKLADYIFVSICKFIVKNFVRFNFLGTSQKSGKYTINLLFSLLDFITKIYFI